MTKSNTASDRLKYPNWFYNPYEKRTIKISGTDKVSKMFTPHHFIRQQWIRNNPERFKKIEHLQSIIFLPTFLPGFNNMHAELHNDNRDFFERWGIYRDEILYNTDYLG